MAIYNRRTVDRSGGNFAPLDYYNKMTVFFKVKDKTTGLYLDSDIIQISVSTDGYTWVSEYRLMKHLDMLRMHGLGKVLESRFEIIRFEKLEIGRRRGSVSVKNYFENHELYIEQRHFFCKEIKNTLIDTERRRRERRK